VLAGLPIDAMALADVVSALTAKDAARVAELSARFPAETRQALAKLTTLYGGAEVLEVARRELPSRPLIHAALDDLQWLAAQLRHSHPEVSVGFDLSDLSGYAYYSGGRFAIYAAGASEAILRGGRYDEVGAVFGRNRPAVGFSMDLKGISAIASEVPRHAAIRAPWADDASLRAAIRDLRRQGETVVCVLPGHDHEAQEYDCDRELVAAGASWVVRGL